MARILHVDDRTEILEWVKDLLEKLGHDVLSATSIFRGRQDLLTGSFDLIIVDGWLEKQGDGLRWAEDLKHKEGRNVVVLSDGGVADGVVSLSKTRMLAEDTYLVDEIEKALRTT